MPPDWGQGVFAVNPTLAGGSDDEAANTGRFGQERLLCGGQTRMSNVRQSRPTAQNDALPASTVMGGKHVGPYFDALFPPQEVSTWVAWKIRSTGVGVARRMADRAGPLPPIPVDPAPF